MAAWSASQAFSTGKDSSEGPWVDSLARLDDNADSRAVEPVDSEHCAKRRRLCETSSENVAAENAHRPFDSQCMGERREEKKGASMGNYLGDERIGVCNSVGRLRHKGIGNEHFRSLQVYDIHLDPAYRSVLDATERVVAAALYCKGVTELPKSVLLAATETVCNFLQHLIRETKRQAEIAQRSRANFFDVTRALTNRHPRVAARLFTSGGRFPPILSEQNEEFLRQVHRQLLPLRSIISGTTDPSFPHVDSREFISRNMPTLESPEYWQDVGEEDGHAAK